MGLRREIPTVRYCLDDAIRFFGAYGVYSEHGNISCLELPFVARLQVTIVSWPSAIAFFMGRGPLCGIIA